jgi:hypothetical protein
MVPDFVNKFTSGKKDDSVVVEEVDDMDDIIQEAEDSKKE